ncbi:hypothetical protein D9758_009504 [Tetrapyrgos nigripes]|uniref:Uncharacterized protein n=1 Tax=Tetrapyrgos nigripes TaxID=182062 RepID=A0A8H5G159_9AGAR|nr:hypothetical protein D9758_009504 [Tetrapyrgos nigripes]
MSSPLKRRAATKVISYQEEDDLFNEELAVDTSTSRNSRKRSQNASDHYEDEAMPVDNSSSEEYEEKEVPSLSSKSKGRKRAPRKDLNSSPKKTPRKSTGKTKKKSKLDMSQFFWPAYRAQMEGGCCIFEFCDPTKLLLLFHTPDLRDILLKAPDAVWRAARENVGMPELEAKDISERQYITLVFNKDCHNNCGMRNVQRVNFVNCARLCGDCLFATKFERKSQYEKYLRSLHPKAFECAKDSAFSDTGYRKPRGIEKLLAKLRDMRGKELDDFVEHRRILKEQIARDARRIREWVDQQDTKRYQSAEDKKQSRKVAIRAKLLSPEMGWNEDDLDDVFWAGWKEIDQPAELTPAIWKRIKDPLLNTLRLRLIETRNRERRDVLRARYRVLLQDDPKPDIFPSFETFSHFPDVEPLWNKNKCSGDDTPEPVERETFVVLDETEWNAALVPIKASVATYQVEMETLAKERLVKAYTDKGLVVPSDPIQDPRSMFRYKAPLVLNLDYPDERDAVLPFPAIHRVMRDRQDGSRFNVVAAVAAEFRTVPEVRGWFDGRNDTLKVDLGATACEGGMPF